MAASPGVLIVVGGGRSEYRGYILEHVSRRHRIVLLSPQPPTWERPYIADHVLVEAGDDEGILAAAAEVARTTEVSGVVTYHEACVELVARIGEAIGVPHCDPRAAARCRDKFAAHEAFRRAGVPAARFLLVHTVEEARKAASELGYPVVVKPRALTASFGVSLVADADDLERAVRTAGANAFPEPWAFRAGVLVEEYLDGPEISVDCAVRDGIAQPLIFARKLLGFPPYFEELGHIVAEPEEVAADPGGVRAVVADAHRALGVDNAVTHTEVRLTEGGPRVIEVNGRLGGDIIPYVAHVATGLDLAAASAEIATGGEPDLSAPRRGVAGIRFFYTASAGRVVSAGMAGGFTATWLRDVTWLVEPGDELRPAPGRLHFARVGYAVVTADTVEECARRMETADGRHALELAPLR